MNWLFVKWLIDEASVIHRGLHQQGWVLHPIKCLYFGLSLAELGGLIKYIRPFLKTVSKAKAAKLVRNLVDVFLDMEASTGMEVNTVEPQ